MKHENNKAKVDSIKYVELLRGPLAALHELQRAELCFNSLGLNKSDVVCEIGCGAGFASFWLSKRCKKVIAIDISEPLIEFLSKRPHPNNLEFCVIDATQNPPKSLCNMFDKFICIDAMEHVEDPLSLLNFVSQILKTGEVV